MLLIKPLNSKYSYILLFASILSLGLLIFPFFGDIQGFNILLNNFDKSNLNMNLFFVWLIRIIYINLIIFQTISIIIKKLAFSGIVFAITCLSLVGLLFVIWSSNSVNARTLLSADSAKPTVFVYLIFIILTVSIVSQYKIIFSRLGDKKIEY